VEGVDADPGDLRPVQGEATGAYRLSDVRHLRQAAGSRRLIVDDLGASLTRVFGPRMAQWRADTPLRDLGLDDDGWVCLSWSLDGRIRDRDIASLRTIDDLRRVLT